MTIPIKPIDKSHYLTIKYLFYLFKLHFKQIEIQYFPLITGKIARKIRYYFELDNNVHADEFINLIKDKLNEGNVTLLYAAKNEDYNHANVLKEWIEERI